MSYGSDEIRKVKLLKDYEYFAKYFFKVSTGKSLIICDYHRDIIKSLRRVVRGETTRLIINCPPRYTKTELVIKLFVAWCMANSSSAKFIHLSYSDDLALDNSSAIREIIKTDEFQKNFPLKLRIDSDSKRKWFNESGGGVYATGAGGAVTGFGAGSVTRVRSGNGLDADGFGGCILIDDPLKPDDAFSDTMRDRINRRFNNTIASRTNSPETPIVVIMQRLHEDDLTGYLLNGGSGEEWEHLMIPAITSEGEALWPEKHSIERLRQMEKADPYTFSGQYMQRPSPLEGGVIKPDNITIIPVLPMERIDWVRGWDFASTTTGDFTAGAKLGRMADGRIIIADMVRIRVGPDERDAALVNTCKRDGEEVKVSIPKDPGQAGLTQVKYLIRQLAGFRVEATPETGSKEVRAGPVASQINVGNVLMLKADWNDALVSEMRMFPNGTFDDQVDAVSRAYSMLIGNNPGEIFIPEIDEKKVIDGLPHHVSEELQNKYDNVCGSCSSFIKETGNCDYRNIIVRQEDIACDSFIS